MSEAASLERRIVEPVAIARGVSRAGSAVAAETAPLALPVVLDGERREVVLDFGQETVGYLTIDIAADAPAAIDVWYGEYCDEALRRHPSPLVWYHDQGDRFTLPAGASSHRSAARRALRYARLAVDPSDASRAATVSITGVRCETVGYPVQRRGSFESSDGRLNAIWAAAERTTRLCMQSFYEDGVKRDGLLWIGDYRIQYLCNAMLYGDVRLARRCLGMIAASQRDDGALPACAARGGGHQHPDVIDCMPGIPAGLQDWVLVDYDADFLCAVREYAVLSGDATVVEELRDCLARLFGYLCDAMPPAESLPHGSMKVGSFLTDNGHQWSRTGLVSHAALIARLVEGLGAGIQLAEHLGEANWRESLARRRVELAALLRERYWDGRRGLFADEPNDGNAPKSVSWHANTAAVRAGVVKGDEAARVVDTLLATPEAARPLAGNAWFHALRGLAAAGRRRKAVDCVRELYGPVIDSGLNTCPEFLLEDVRAWFHHEPDAGRGGRNDQVIMSLCHGWSAAPAVVLPECVLGVRALEPGWRRVAIEPELCGLAWARGTVPTPRGEIAVELERRGDGTAFARVELPEDVEGVMRWRPDDAQRVQRGRAEFTCED